MLARAHAHCVQIEFPDTASPGLAKIIRGVTAGGPNSRHLVQDALRRPLPVQLSILQTEIPSYERTAIIISLSLAAEAVPGRGVAYLCVRIYDLVDKFADGLL